MLIGFIIIILTLGFDQLTKYLASTLIPLNSPHIVWIPGVLEITYSQNTGMSFGLLEGRQGLFMLATVIALAIFGYLFYYSDFKHKKVYSIAMALFISGTLGNAIDRALYGYVIDFMNFPFVDTFLNFFKLPGFTNNWADMYLSAAIVLFALDLFIFEEKRKKKEVAKPHEDIQS